MDSTFIWVIIFVQAIFFGMFSGALAEGKGYKFGIHFICGLIFSIFGLLYAIGLQYHPEKLKEIITDSIISAQKAAKQDDKKQNIEKQATEKKQLVEQNIEKWETKPATVHQENIPPAPRIECPYCHEMVYSYVENCYFCGKRIPKKREK